MERLIRRSAIAIALAIAILPPLTYVLASLDAQRAVMTTEAEINAEQIEAHISRNPALWQFETERLVSLLANRPRDGALEIRRIRDSQGTEIAATIDAVPAPLRTVHTRLYDSGRSVGSVEVARSLAPIIETVVVVSVVSVALALLALVTLVRLPLRALRRALSDLEESRAKAQEIQRARDRAETAAELRSTFLAKMSHELRTPMNGIMGTIQIVQGTRLDEHQQRFLAMAYASAEDLMDILQDILEFTQLETEHLEVQSQPFSPSDVVNNVIAAKRGAATAKGLRIDVNIADSLPALVQGDAVRVGRVLGILFDNAVKFTPNGFVEVRVAPIASIAGEPRVAFSVRDSGIGIAADQLSNIFEPFTQADSSSTRRYGGCGLGLAVAQRLVDKMGGVLTVESVEGVGSTFRFDLPLPAAPVNPA